MLIPMGSPLLRIGDIHTCNNFLDNYNRAEIDQDVKDVYAAEVKVIRSWVYFMLTTFFGDVPWINHVITSEGAYGPRTPRSAAQSKSVIKLSITSLRGVRGP